MKTGFVFSFLAVNFIFCFLWTCCKSFPVFVHIGAKEKQINLSGQWKTHQGPHCLLTVLSPIEELVFVTINFLKYIFFSPVNIQLYTHRRKKKKKITWRFSVFQIVSEKIDSNFNSCRFTKLNNIIKKIWKLVKYRF